VNGFESVVAPRSPRWPFPAWFGPALFAYIAWTWWQVSKTQIDAATGGADIPPALGASLALLARCVGWLLESGYYVLWWKWRRRTLPFWWYFQWTVAISMLDLLAEAIRRDVPVAAAVTWRTWWVGVGAGGGVEAAVPGGWVVAFGGVGLLTLVRLAMVIRVQREALGPVGLGPLWIVAATCLAGRLVALWSHDLLRGARLP
jgi:hypothetical protein